MASTMPSQTKTAAAATADQLTAPLTAALPARPSNRQCRKLQLPRTRLGRPLRQDEPTSFVRRRSIASRGISAGVGSRCTTPATKQPDRPRRRSARAECRSSRRRRRNQSG